MQILTVVGFFEFVSIPIHAQGVVYTVKDLGAFSGGDLSWGNAVNDSGQVTGVASGGPGGFEHAFRSGPNGGPLTDLGTLGGDISGGTAINSSGQVTGYAFTSGNGNLHAFFSDPNGGPLRDLGTLGGTLAQGDAINDSGQVTGRSSLPGGNVQHAFLSGPNGGALTDLGTLGGNGSNGFGINSRGQVAGSASTPTSDGHAFVTGPNGTPMIDLGTLGGTSSGARGINDAGQVVGSTEHAFLHQPNGNSLIDLGTLGGNTSGASAINSSGEIVGSSDLAGGASHAFLYTAAGGMQDLSNLISPQSGFTVAVAYGINNVGQITGFGNNSAGRMHAYLLTPSGVSLQSVVSRIAHGMAGTFDLNLPLNGSPTVECRSGGTNGTFTLIFTFATLLNSVGAADVGNAVGSVTNASIDQNDGHNYVVQLGGVSNAQRITVTLHNVSDANGRFTIATSVTVAFLLGDTNGDGVVNAGDTIQVRSQAGNDISSSNFRMDVNADGLINAGDTIVVRGQSGMALPTQSTTRLSRISGQASKGR